jgi:hypothetical protein
MSQLGTLISNRFTNAHRAMLKPHLRQRLALHTNRTTVLGLIAAGPDGRLSFKPSYVPQDGDRPAMPRPVFQPGQRVRVRATMAELLAQEVYPFKPEEAMAVAGCEGVVVESATCSVLGLVLVLLEGQHWTFVPQYLTPASGAQGEDERETTASGPAFDPYTEPLALGDIVQGMDGRIGRVTLVEPCRLGMVFERGSAWCGDMVWRASFRLLAKADAWGCSNGCPF